MTWAEVGAACAAVAAVSGLAITSMLTVGKLGHLAGTMETTLAVQNAAISDLKDEIKKLSEIIAQIAVQRVEIQALSSEQARLRSRLDELAHGEGFVFPLRLPPAMKPEG